MEIPQVTISDLNKALRASYCKETAGIDDLWTPRNPAYSQCSPTTLIVQDFFGGQIKQYTLPLEWQDKLSYSGHNLNKLPTGEKVDLTKDQFPDDFPYEKFIRGRIGTPRPGDNTINMITAYFGGLGCRYKLLLEKVLGELGLGDSYKDLFEEFRNKRMLKYGILFPKYYWET